MTPKQKVVVDVAVVERIEDVVPALMRVTGLSLAEVENVFRTSANSEESFARFAELALARGYVMVAARDGGEN